MLRALISLLFPVFLAMAPGPTIAQGTGDPVPEVGATDRLGQAHRKLADGDDSGAREDLIEAVEQLRGTGRSEQLLGALVSLAQIDEAANRPRQALDWWLQSLLPADLLAHAPDSTNTDIGVVVRVQIAALLLSAGDTAGSEQMGWDAVVEALAVARADAVPVGVLTILRVAALDGEAAVNERVVELDELLGSQDWYRLHSLPRPLPLAFMAHDVARQFAEAALLDRAEAAFATAARTYLALEAPDLAARALVDLSRAAMELSALDRAERAASDARRTDARAAQDAGIGAVEAELLVRRGRPDAAVRFLSLAQGAEGATRALYLGRSARLVGIDSPEDAAELHRRAAEVLRAEGASAEALMETVFRAFQLARGGATRPAMDVLGGLDGAMAKGLPPRLPSDLTARLEATRAQVHRAHGEAGLARNALAAAGAVLFQRGDTDAVAGVAAQYVGLALDGGDPAAIEAALDALLAMEESLGLRVEGWRGLAAQAAVALHRGEMGAAHARFAEAASRVERSAADREPAREAPLFGGPGDLIYGPWLESLLASGQHEAAFEVLQRWRGWTRAPWVAERDPDGLRAQAVQLREALRVISTRATKEDPVALRAPLLDEQARISELLPGSEACGVGAVQAALPPRAGLLDGVTLPTGDWVFALDRTGLDVSRVPSSGSLSRRDAVARRVKSWTSFAHTGLVDWGRPGTRTLGMACDAVMTWAPVDPSRVIEPTGLLVDAAMPEPGPDAISQALHQVEPPSVDLAGAVWIASEPPSPAEALRLQRAGAGAVIHSADLDVPRFRAAMAAGKSLDEALAASRPRRPRRAGPDPTIVWGPLP